MDLKHPLSVDLNCDMGESFGAYRLGQDEDILPFVTSANIACGFHAGDPLVMQQTVRRALNQGVAVGAHPGLPDLVGFGRREMAVSAREVYAIVVYQVGALAAFVQAEGGMLRHVKPHGALYNMAATQPLLAEAIAEAVYKIFPKTILYGLAGSELIRAGEKLGLQTAHEVFADRTYQPKGILTPRTQPMAMITDPEEAVQQVLRMVREGKVQTVAGTDISIKADTICIHGDGSQALAFARALRHSLEAAGILVQAINGK